MPIYDIPPCKEVRVQSFIYVDFRTEQGDPRCYVARRVVPQTNLKELERQRAAYMTALAKQVLDNEQIDHMISLETAIKNAHLAQAQSAEWRIESANRSRL